MNLAELVVLVLLLGFAWMVLQAIVACPPSPEPSVAPRSGSASGSGWGSGSVPVVDVDIFLRHSHIQQPTPNSRLQFFGGRQLLPFVAFNPHYV